ncbi:MAG: prenyltransferase [Myxococcales bacterium]|nr:prenyltransferase [Myxococcales bacterium]
MSTNTAAESPGLARRDNILAGIWRVADPKITLASVAAMILGGSIAAWQGPLSAGWLAVTVLGIFCIEAAKNASGEIFDWDSGADQGLKQDERTPFSGGKRVLVDGLMTRRQCAIMAAVFYALGIGAGLAIVLLREPSVMALGVVGVALAYFYHAPPFSLSYRGLGEAAVALAYGPVIACGTYLVQRHDVSLAVMVASLPLGLAIMGFLWINEFPDARADAEAGKRTLVVRLGRARAARVFAGLVGVTYLGVALLPLLGLPLGVLGGFLGLPLSVRAAMRLAKHHDHPQEIVPAQGWTLLSFVLLSLGAGAGISIFG